MTQASTTPSLVAPPSPCVSICTLDDANRCLGCSRTLTEIQRWTRMSAEEQWRIVRRAQMSATADAGS